MYRQPVFRNFAQIIMLCQYYYIAAAQRARGWTGSKKSESTVSPRSHTFFARGVGQDLNEISVECTYFVQFFCISLEHHRSQPNYRILNPDPATTNLDVNYTWSDRTDILCLEINHLAGFLKIWHDRV